MITPEKGSAFHGIPKITQTEGKNDALEVLRNDEQVLKALKLMGGFIDYLENQGYKLLNIQN